MESGRREVALLNKFHIASSILPSLLKISSYYMNETFDSVWDAIEETPAEAENMKLRPSIMTAILDFTQREGLTQKEAAKTLGVTQPRISDLKRGKIDLFALASLVGMLAAAELRLDVQIAKAA